MEGEGHSIYFDDYHNHLFELHTGTLLDRERLAAVVADSQGQASAADLDDSGKVPTRGDDATGTPTRSIS
jgi:hypothetical protein